MANATPAILLPLPLFIDEKILYKNLIVVSFLGTAAVSSNTFGNVFFYKISLSLHCEGNEAHINECSTDVVFKGCHHRGVYCKGAAYSCPIYIILYIYRIS